MSPVVQDAEQAPCGCRWGTLDGAFVFEPCSETCELYAHAIEENRKQGKPVAHVDNKTGSFLSGPMFCPSCDKTVDAHAGLSGALVPDDGDVGICFYCAGVFVFDGGRLRHPRPAEEQTFAHDEELQKAIAFVKAQRI